MNWDTMTDRLDAIEADLKRPEVLNTENGCSVANVGSGDVRWLVAEVRRCHARRCESCKHQRCYGDYEECDRTQGDDYGNRTECKTMGGGCLAWEKRDEA